MTSARWAAVLVAATFAAGDAYADVEVGDKAAAIEVDKLLNTEFKNLKPLQGSLVLYEYFAHW